MKTNGILAALAACALALLAAGCNNGFTDAALNAMKNNAEQTVPVEGITLDRGTLRLITGGTVRLTAEITPKNASDKKVDWSSSDEKIATVSDNGTVTAVAEGTAVITAKAGSLTATCTVNVTACSHYYSNGKCIYCGLELPTVGGFQIDNRGTLTEYAGNDTNVVIPEGVTSIGYGAFKDNTGLTSVEIPASVTSIGSSAFYGCSGLTSVEIPEGVTSIGDSAFYGCSGLTSVEIPEGVTSIGYRAFYGCSGLTSVTYTGTKEEWGNINIDSNSGLLGKTIACTDGDITVE